MPGLPHRAFDMLFSEHRARGANTARQRIEMLEKRMFDRQRDVYNDPAKRKAVLTTRRAGKTDGIATRKLISLERHPGANSWCGYATLTKGQSRQNIDGPIRQIAGEMGIQITPREVDGQLIYQHANGARLWVGGVDDMRKAERRRGNKWWDFDIDEGGAWPAEILEYFVDDVVEPALTDTDGTLTINGTPGELAAGYFFEVSTPGDTLVTGKAKRPQWSTHSWSVTDNPHHRFGQPGGKEALEELRLSKGWDLDNPTWLREWCGQWSTDPDALVYRYEGVKNAFYEVPQGDKRWALGVDVGHDDDTAFVLTCSVKNAPYIYVVRAWGAPGMTQPQRAQEILRIQAALKAKYHEQALVAFDTGGLGKALAFDLLRTYGAASNKADKYDKGASIRTVRDALLAGRLFVCPYSPNPDDPIGLGAAQLLSEWSILPWDDERKDHRKGYADHCPDALLYSFRCHPSYETWDKEPPTPGTPEAANAEMAEYKARVMREQQIRQSGMRASEKRNALRRLRGR